MKITGYKLQHRLRELHHLRDMAASQFDHGRSRFDDDNKPTSKQAFDRYEAAEATIAKLQTAQSQYNLALRVDVLGESLTLAEAVKRVGGAGRMEKMWRSIAVQKKDRYGFDNDEVRDAGSIRAKATVTVDEAAGYAQKAARFASALREAIQVANATAVEIDELDPSLFE